MMVELLAYYRGKSMESFLNQFPVKSFETDDDYIWDIVGSSRRNIPLVEARALDNTTILTGMAGEAYEPFYLVFAEDWFSDQDVIWGNLNETYPLIVLGDPIFEGTLVKYKVCVYGTNSRGIPAERLQAGERFSIGYNPVERSLSRKVGDRVFECLLAA